MREVQPSDVSLLPHLTFIIDDSSGLEKKSDFAASRRFIENDPNIDQYRPKRCETEGRIFEFLVTRDQSRAYALLVRGEKDFYLVTYLLPSMEQHDEYKLEGSYQKILKASLDEKFLMIVALEPSKTILIFNLEDGAVKDLAFSYKFEYTIYNLFLSASR